MAAPLCSGPKCVRTIYCKSMCEAHYDQTRRGNVLTPLRANRRGMPENDRFWDQVDLRDFGGCWNWIGAETNGRGTFTKGSGRGKTRTTLTHRYSYQFFNPDEVIDSLTIHHKCANSLCVNPDHLQAISHINNVAEMNERQYYLRRIAELEAQVAELKGRKCDGCC